MDLVGRQRDVMGPFALETTAGDFALGDASSPYCHQPRGRHLEFSGGLIRSLDLAQPDRPLVPTLELDAYVSLVRALPKPLCVPKTLSELMP